jgi:hypothetical protein
MSGRSALDLICCHLFEVSSYLVSMHCHCTVFQFMHLYTSVDCTCAFWRLGLSGTLWHGMWYMITTLTKEPNTSIIRTEETSSECRLCYGSDSYCPVTTEAHVSPHQIYGGQSGTGAGFSLSTVLLLSPVSVIPPILFNSFIHPSIYHWCHKILAIHGVIKSHTAVKCW